MPLFPVFSENPPFWESPVLNQKPKRDLEHLLPGFSLLFEARQQADVPQQRLLARNDQPSDGHGFGAGFRARMTTHAADHSLRRELLKH